MVGHCPDLKRMALDRQAFLKRFDHPLDAVERAGLDWGNLENIHGAHSKNVEESKFDPIAESVVRRLRCVLHVHSLKYRIKEPDRLIDKIIRKGITGVTPENYFEHVTDVVGVRALHLFKEHWTVIHDFITKNWTPNESPLASHRRGDPDELLESFKRRGCEIEEN